MARADNLHSRLVNWLKVLLPLTALAILSTLFLVARTIDPADAIKYTDVDVADRLRDPRMTAPTFAGQLSDGASLTVTADTAQVGTATKDGGATALHAELATPDGAKTTLSADVGTIDTQNNTLNFSGGVNITTSSGYNITTESLTAALDRTGLASQSAVNATGPLGNISANQMQITADPVTPGSYVLVFKDGVKLIYDPTKR